MAVRQHDSEVEISQEDLAGRLQEIEKRGTTVFSAQFGFRAEIVEKSVPRGGASPAESNCVRHSLFGRITRQDWDQFNLRHAELPMNFVQLA